MVLSNLLKSFFLPGVILRNDEIKLLETEPFIWFSLMGDKTCVHQVEKGLVVHVFANCSGNLFQFLESNVALFLGIVKRENSLQAVFCLVLADLWANAIDKLFEIEGFVLFTKRCYDILDEGATLVKVQLLEYFVDFDWIDLATSVLIED